jgi:hypothetical protein
MTKSQDITGRPALQSVLTAIPASGAIERFVGEKPAQLDMEDEGIVPEN